MNQALGTGSNESFYRTVDQQIVGDNNFVEKTGERIETVKRPIKKPSLQKIAGAVEKITGITWDEIISRSRRKEVVFARGVKVETWRELGHHLVDLQPKLRRDLSVLSRLSKITESQKGQNAMRQIFRSLNACL